jgi:PAS domain S-box-containing protein
MSTPLNILILEDRSEDAQLMLYELRQAGYDPRAQRVDDEAGFIAALDPSLDIILADYNLPAWTGLAALALVQQSGFDIPVIIVSGVVGDEKAAAIMQQGADDFLLKDRLARLGSAVAHAITARRLRRERREADESLRVAHGQLRQLLDHNPAVLYAIEPEDDLFRVRVTSGSVSALLGFSPSEITAPDWWTRQLHPDDRARVLNDVRTTFVAGSSHTEYRMQHKDGHYCWVDDARRLVYDENDLPTGMVGVWIDITDRKRAEAERERLASELQAAQSKIRILSGLLPICASCKKIRDEHDVWHQIESYIRSHSEARFTHGVCPDCVRELYPEHADEIVGAARTKTPATS